MNVKTVRRILKKNNLALPARKHKGRTKTRNLFRPSGPDQLWETDITYIPTLAGMTYLMCIKDCFSKEWQGYRYSMTCMASDAIKSVEDAVMRAFNGNVPQGLVLRTDNGPQYISRKFREAMRLLGIRIEYIRKETPEDKGYAANCITSDTSEQTFLWVGSDPASLFFHFHLTGICEPGSS